MHAISTQKKLLGDPTVYVPPFIFTCDGVQLTRERKRKGAKLCDGPTTTSTLLAVHERRRIKRRVQPDIYYNGSVLLLVETENQEEEEKK